MTRYEDLLADARQERHGAVGEGRTPTATDGQHFVTACVDAGKAAGRGDGAGRLRIVAQMPGRGLGGDGNGQ